MFGVDGTALGPGTFAASRLTHARRHLAALDSNIDQFMRETTKFSVDIAEDGLIVEIGDQAVAPLSDWDFGVGDVVMNLRAALDGLLWDLTTRRKGTPSEPLSSRWRSVRFPICDSHEKWVSATRGRGDSLWGLPPDVREVIYQIQPFQIPRPRSHPLALLDYLTNANKHRLSPVLLRKMPSQTIPVIPSPFEARFLRGRPSVPFAGRQTLAKLALEARYPPGEGPVLEEGDSIEVALKLRFDVSVVFGPGRCRGRHVIETLRRCSDAVEEAIGAVVTAYREGRLVRIGP